MGALRRLGYRPQASVDIAGFVTPEKRTRRVSEKGMLLFQLVSNLHRTVPIDVFAQEPFDFEAVCAAAPLREVDDGVEIRVVPLAQLIGMKERANRPKDQLDLLYSRHFMGWREHMNLPADPASESDDWDGAEDEHLRDALRWTFQDRLKRLEDAVQVVSSLCPAHEAPSDPLRASSRSANE